MFLVDGADFVRYLFRAFLLGMALSPVFLSASGVKILLSEGPAIFRRLAFLVLFIYDVFTFLLASFLNILMVFSANRGQVRLMALLFEVAGFLLLFLPLYKISLKIQRKVILFLKKKVVLPLINGLRARGRFVFGAIKKRKTINELKKYNDSFEKRSKKEISEIVTLAKKAIFQRNDQG